MKKTVITSLLFLLGFVASAFALEEGMGKPGGAFKPISAFKTFTTNDQLKRFDKSLAFVGGVYPKTDIVETAESYAIYAEVPGIQKKDIQLSFSGNLLTIKGKKPNKFMDGNVAYLTRERSFGSFERVVSLPSLIKFSEKEIEMKNGVLKIRIPKLLNAQFKNDKEGST